MVIDATTGERWPIWSEIDSNATDPNRAALLIHPAVNFAAKHRYIVALRDLRTAGGQEIPAPNGFLYYRDKLRSEAAVINQRRDHFKSIFKTLQKAHIKRKDLYLAWDFTVSSDENIAARMLHIRNDAFAQLGDTNLADLAVAGAAPQFSVSSVQNFTAAESPNLARLVQGTFTVPCYLRPDCAPGGTFQLDSNGLPTRNGNWTANFICIIPRAAIDPGARPSRPSLYGHGLLAAPWMSSLPTSRHWRSWPTLPSAPPIRSASPPTFRPCSRSCRTSPTSRNWGTGSSRDCSTSSSWGG